MLPIKRIELPEQLIISGATSDVYAFSTDKILKLYKREYNLKNISKEIEIHHAVLKSGYQVFKVENALYEYKGRYGIVGERVEGIMLREFINGNIDKLHIYFPILINLQRDINANAGDDYLTDQQRFYSDKINSVRVLTGIEKNQLLKLLASMPEKKMLCHGDLHPRNIMLNGDTARAIDWENAYAGDPISDITRTLLLLWNPQSIKDIKSFKAKLAGIKKKRCFLKIYKKLQSWDKKHFERWLLINCAARLSETTIDNDYLLWVTRKLMRKIAI